MKLKRVLFRDEEYFYESCISTQFTFSGSYLKIYKKRKKTLFNWREYDLLGQREGGKEEVVSVKFIKEALKELVIPKFEKPLIIECSKEVEDLYK
jgi:hypothetical protein